MFDRFRRHFTSTASEATPPAPPNGAPAASGVPHTAPLTDGERAAATPPRRERTLSAPLAGLKPAPPPRSGLAHTRDKMRHRRRDFTIPFFQTGHTGQPIGPQDVAHPRYTRTDHADIDPQAPPTQHDRIERYATRVQNRAASASPPAASAQSPQGSGTVPDIARQREAATGALALRRFIDNAFPVRAASPLHAAAGAAPMAHAPRVGAASDFPPVLPAIPPQSGFAADVAAALGWETADVEGDSLAGVMADAVAAGGVAGTPEQAQAALAERLARLGGPHAAGETMHGALIAAALAHTGIGQPRVALAVLARCATLPLATLTSATALRALDEAGRRAVQLMTILARGNGCNFDAFAALRADAGHPVDAAFHAHAVQALLGAAGQASLGATAVPAPAPAPAAPRGEPHEAARRHTAPIPAYAAPAVDTLIDKLETHRHDPAAALSHRTIGAAARLLNEGAQALSERERYDLFSWRQGDRDDAPGSDLARKNHRLEKFVTRTIPRLAQSRWERARNLPRRILGKDKSPLSAPTLGLGGVPRDTLQNEQAKLRAGMREALDELTRAPAGGTSPLDATAALRHADPIGSLVELAALHVWLEGGLTKDRVTAADLPVIAGKARTLAEAATPDAPEGVALAAFANRNGEALRGVAPFAALDGRHYTADMLERWGTIARIPKTGEAPFWNHVDSLRKLAEPPEARLDQRSVTHGRDLLIDVIGKLKAGARLRLSDGHRYGFSTRGLSATVTNFLHLSSVPVSAQLNVQARRGKEAVVEISRSLQGVEIFVGTARRTATHVEAGVFAGYRFDLGLAEARAGATVNALLHASERGEVTGVSIGIARRPNEAGTGYQDDAMLEKATGIVAELFAAAATREDAHAEGERTAEVDEAASTSAAQRVFARHFDDADLTLSWTDTRDKGYSAGVSVAAGMTLRLPEPAHDGAAGSDTGADAGGAARATLPLGLGPAVGLAYIRDHGLRQDAALPAADATPANPAATVVRQDARRVEQHRHGGGSRWVGRLGVGTNSNLPVSVDGTGRSIGLGLLTLDTPAMHFTFRNTRMSARLQLVRDERRLNHRACVLDREFAGPSAYIRAVESERAQWAMLFATEHMRKNGTPYATALEEAHVVIDRHLANARANWRPNQVLFTRHRLREHAARMLDLNAALRDQLAPAGRDTPAALQALTLADARILEDAASYMPVELKGKESVDRERLLGPNAFLHVSTRKAVASTREFVAQNVSFKTMDERDRVLPRRDPAPGG
ncbi:hypothetical protein OVY01_05555 [Robbsia sp. Bb-Pol-6]|uniref:Type III effector protein n=1 Tax=Robbsia betulipollinis TaxID=2981849 RepID=A0ABT3ZJL6_9BURK|nr:hypothetical protein [Robbsia betulipollinis]MCY0386710.1 hypothetical protein [Robbsia betulipollinis]